MGPKRLLQKLMQTPFAFSKNRGGSKSATGVGPFFGVWTWGSFRKTPISCLGPRPESAPPHFFGSAPPKRRPGGSRPGERPFFSWSGSKGNLYKPLFFKHSAGLSGRFPFASKAMQLERMAVQPTAAHAAFCLHTSH